VAGRQSFSVLFMAPSEVLPAEDGSAGRTGPGRAVGGRGESPGVGGLMAAALGVWAALTVEIMSRADSTSSASAGRAASAIGQVRHVPSGDLIAMLDAGGYPR